MGLDFCIIGTSGFPIMEVTIWLTDQEKILAFSTTNEIPLLNRVKDYYTDIVFLPEEIELLKREISDIILTAQNDKKFYLKLRKLKKLCTEAIKLKTGIIAIAD